MLVNALETLIGTFPDTPHGVMIYIINLVFVQYFLEMFVFELILPIKNMGSKR